MPKQTDNSLNDLTVIIQPKKDDNPSQNTADVNSSNVKKSESNEGTTQKEELEPNINLNITSNGMRSLFDDNAYIDYARYMQGGIGPKDWKSYNSKEVGEENNKTTEFQLNSTITDYNKPVLYAEKETSLDVNSILTWSEKYPSMRLKGQDFAYCKKIGYYPNNRLIILRRFQGGVPDNLFDYYNVNNYNTSPISTLVTWLSPDVEELLELTFNEKWVDNDLGIMDAVQNTSEDSSNKKNKESITSTFRDSIMALVGDSIVKKYKDFKHEDGTEYKMSFEGNPNLIKASKKRVTGGGGLESDIRFKLKFEYEMRYIKGIDPSIAMLDLISNCIRMGTSTESFKYNIPLLKESEIVQSFMQNDFDRAVDELSKKLEEYAKEIKTNFTKLLNNAGSLIKETVKNPDKAVGDALGGVMTYIFSNFREALKAAITADTGLPSGVWHVTIGNPKSPTIACGDLVLKTSSLKIGNELGFNDFPNSFSVEYTLESARERGRDGLSQILNTGRGRVYTYKDYRNNPDYYRYIPLDKNK